MLVDVVTAYVDGATAEGYAEDWDLEQLWTALKTLYPVGIDHHDLIDSDAVGEPGELTRDELLDALLEDAERAYAEREKQLEEIAGEGAMRQLERNVLLNVIDRKWREHLYEMDYLKEGIGLRAMAQRDPLVEYQREGYDMFVGMLDGHEGGVGRASCSTSPWKPRPRPPWRRSPRRRGWPQFAAEAAAQGAGQCRRHQGAAGEQPAAIAGSPAALRAKGIEDDAPPLTYTGPSEDGSAQVQRRRRRQARRADGHQSA